MKLTAEFVGPNIPTRCADVELRLSHDVRRWLADNSAVVDALASGAWKAVPVDPTIGMLDRIISLSECETDDDLYDIWSAMLAAAPAKPGDEG